MANSYFMTIVNGMHLKFLSLIVCLLLTVFPIKSLSLHFSEINVLLFPTRVSGLPIPNCFPVHSPARIF